MAAEEVMIFDGVDDFVKLVMTSEESVSLTPQKTSVWDARTRIEPERRCSK
jgi:hypothetical protein